MSSPRPDERDYARLLAGRDQPSVLEKEALFERVYAEARPGANRRTAVLRGVMLAAGSAAVLLIGLAIYPTLVRQPEFASRGGGASRGAAASFSLRCLFGGEVGPCRQGAKLVLDRLVPPPSIAPSGGYFAAFARRADGVDIWYLPDADAKSAAVPGDQQALDQVVLIDASHPPGSYTVYGVFTSQSLSRAQLKQRLGESLQSAPGVTVVTRPLEVIEAGQ